MTTLEESMAKQVIKAVQYQTGQKIDWEKRRWELAVSLYVQSNPAVSDIEGLAEKALRCADGFIKVYQELKEQEKWK